MARRASSATNPKWFFIAALLVVVAIGVGWWLKSRVSDPFRTLPPLPVGEYQQNGASLRGNTYKVDGIIKSMITFQPDARLFEVDIDGTPVPIRVPSQFNALDLREGGRFQFKVEVSKDTMLEAKDVRKE